MASSFKTEEDVIKDAIKNNKPTIQRDLVITKTFLKQQSAGGDNVYDHLRSILSKVIDERPKDVMDYFEEFSRAVRMEKNRNSNALLADTYVEPDSLKCAKTHLRCFNRLFHVPQEESIRIDDFMHLQFFWSLAGYGCPQGQAFALSCSIAFLQCKPVVRKCRYWGQIYGLKLNYYIAEVELTDEELKNRTDRAVGQEEQWGTGSNRKSYFVCSCLGNEWIELPILSSKDIEMSEKITKYFTGDLNASIRSNPQFHGSERKFLRATIQRITTEAYAAPVGYYNIINEGGVFCSNDEVTLSITVLIGNASINSNFNPIEETKLLDLSSWCQYRMTKTPLCSENSSSPSIPIWSIRRMQQHFPKTSMVLIRSNIWPGAVSFCSRLEHDSLYNGWGVKYRSKAFIPPLPLTTSKEYDFNAKAVNDETPGAFDVEEVDSPADD